MKKRSGRESRQTSPRAGVPGTLPAPDSGKLHEYAPRVREEPEGRDTPPERGQPRDLKSPWLGGG